MVTETTIANTVAVMLGEPSITNIDDPGTLARDIRAVFDQVRDAFLRSYNWNFARKRAQLAADPVNPEFGFARRFLLPAECLRFVGFYDPQFPASMTTLQRPHVVEGRYLLCDVDVAQVYYIRKQENAADFDPLFAEALAARIAKRLAFKRSASADLMQAIDAEYDRAMKEARFCNAIENSGEALVQDDFIETRYASDKGWSRAFPGGYF